MSTQSHRSIEPVSRLHTTGNTLPHKRKENSLQTNFVLHKNGMCRSQSTKSWYQNGSMNYMRNHCISTTEVLTSRSNLNQILQRQKLLKATQMRCWKSYTMECHNVLSQNTKTKMLKDPKPHLIKYLIQYIKILKKKIYHNTFKKSSKTLN